MKIGFIGIGKLGKDVAEVINEKHEVIGYDVRKDIESTIQITNNLQEAQLPNIGTSTPRQPNMNPKANMSKEAIMKSGLPDAIKKAMIQNPIPDPVPAPNLSESFMDKVSQKMNSEHFRS